MTQSDSPGTHPSIQDVALIVGGGPGISSSCARLFAKSGMRVGVAARNPESRSWRTWRRLTAFVDTRATQANQLSWSRCSRMSFETSGRLRLSYTTSTAGFPAFLQGHYRSQPSHGARDTSELGVQRVFGRSAGRSPHARKQAERPRRQRNDHLHERERGAHRIPIARRICNGISCQVRLAQSMARELMPQGIHIANVPIDAAIGWTREDGTRAHRRAGATVDDNMADPDRIAETYLQLHRQHRSTWAFEVALRPWVERW